MEEATLPSRKRARIKGASVELALGQGPDVKRDEEVWFTDGNVVLQAGGVAFKVYRGILALDSEVFSGMFSMPQPRAVETFQNCPVIHLTDDPDDVRQLLRVVFIDKSFYRHDTQFPFSVVASVVRIAHKYEMKGVLDDALDRMKSCFSSRLPVWNAAMEKKGSSLMSFQMTDAISAVNLSRLTNTTSMLPIALYMCCQLSTDILLNGVSPKDGILERLAPEDVRACVDAQRTLVHDNIISGYNILAPLPQSNCTDLTCVLSLKYLRELLLKYSGGLDNCDCLADWMVSLQNAELDDEYYGFMHMCPVCQQCIRSRANKERRDIWLTLPETMGVDVDYHITTDSAGAK